MSQRWLLVTRSTHIGSTLLSLPAARAVANQIGPSGELWVCHPTGSPSQDAALELLHCGVRVTGTIPRTDASVAAQFELLRALRARRFDAAVLLNPNRLTRGRAFLQRAFLRAAGIPRLIGFSTMPSSSRGSGAVPRHVAADRLALVAQAGVPVPPGTLAEAARLILPTESVARAEMWLRTQGWEGGPLVAVCPGATAASNRWPLASFVAVGHALRARGCEVVVCGGGQDREAGVALTTAWGGGFNAAGVFPILETAGVLSLCTLLVGLDTGTTHLAAAVGTPCVVVQGGRTQVGMWNPLGDQHVVLRFDVPCAGCGLMQCAISRHPCMRGIAVDEVIAACDRVIPSRRSPARDR